MADLTRIIAPSAAELEAFKAAAERIGRTVREFEFNMVEAFAAVGRAALDAAYPWHGKPPAWLPLTPARRPDPTIGRKRRARRARGRRIEMQRTTPVQIFRAAGNGSGILTVARWAGAQRLMRSHCADAARFWDPSLGEPWEEQAHEADQDPR